MRKKKSTGIYLFEGGVWLGSANAVEMVLGIVKYTLIARFLGPKEFGVFAVASITIGTLDQFTTPGIGKALIHNEQEPEQFLDVIWIFVLLRNLIVATIAWFLAPVISSFLSSPQSKSLIQFMALFFFILGFKSPAILVFRKNLRFKRVALYNHLPIWGDVIVSIVVAWYVKNAWALVAGYCAKSALFVVLSYSLAPYMPKFSFDFDKFKVLFKYSKWVTMERALFALSRQSDKAILSKFLGVSSLGLYTMSQTIVRKVLGLSAKVMPNVLMPGFSKIQNDEERFKKWLNFFVPVSVLLSGFFYTLLFFNIDVLVKMFLGKAWYGTIALIKILSLSLLFEIPVFAIGKAFLDGMGQPHKNFIIGMIYAIELPLMAAIGYYVLGITGVAWGYILTIVSLFFVWLFIMKDFVDILFYKIVFGSLGLNGGIFLIAFSVNSLIRSDNTHMYDWFYLFISFMYVSLLYLMVFIVFGRLYPPLYKNVKNIWYSVIARLV